MTAPASRAEIKFSRLLGKAEESLVEREPHDPGFEQFVKNLEQRLEDLKRSNTWQSRKDILFDYSRRLENLREIIEAEKHVMIMEDPSEVESHIPALPMNNSHKDTKMQTLSEMREELLGYKDEATKPVNEGIRQRLISGNNLPQDDFDAVMRYHSSMQEKTAQEMMSLVQNLKQNSLLTGHILRKDTEVLERSAAMADVRHDQLKVESNNLEVHAKKSCNWCVWIMLGVVCLSFMWMIVFIRLFPKR